MAVDTIPVSVYQAGRRTTQSWVSKLHVVATWQVCVYQILAKVSLLHVPEVTDSVLEQGSQIVIKTSGTEIGL